MTSSAPRHGSAHPPANGGLGDYVLGAELHRSGLGTLQLAWRHAELPHGRPYVVRRLHAEHRADQELCSLVTREVEVARAVQSRNLLPILAGSSASDAPFSVMEYVEGLSIEQLLLSNERPAELGRLLVPAIVDALAGLSALHELRDGQGVERLLTHQAPTPRHILVGLDGVARLTDFTQCAGAGLPWTSATVYRLRPEEMAPEQALSPEHVDPRCDVFIAAGTLWHVLTGRPLFGDDVPEQALQKMLRMQVPSLAEAGLKVGPRLDRLIWQALVRTRRERLQSAAEFAELLRLYAQQAGLYASRDELSEFVRALWEKQAVEEPMPVPAGPAASPQVAKLAAARPTLVGLAPLPADVRAQLQSAVNPISEPPPARSFDTEPRVPYPAATLASQPEFVRPPEPLAPSPPLPSSALPTSAGLGPDQRRSLPRVARELERIRTSPPAPVPGAGDDGDNDEDTEELTWRARSRPVQAAPSTPAPPLVTAEFEPPAELPARPPAARRRAVAYADFQLTQDYVPPSYAPSAAGQAPAPSAGNSDDDDEDDLSVLARRSPMRGFVAGVAAVFALGAAAYAFRAYVTEEAPLAETPAPELAPASPPAAVGASALPSAPAPDPVDEPPTPALIAPEPPSALPPAAPAPATPTPAAELPANESVGLDSAKPARRAKKMARQATPDDLQAAPDTAPSPPRVRSKSGSTPTDENLPFNPYD